MLRIANRIQHFVGIVIGEAETGAGIVIFVVRLYRILQAARLPHDGDGAVAQGHQLAQAAGFKQGRHQECVAGRVNLVGQRVRVINVGGHLVAVLPVKVAEHILVALLAGPQYHQLDVVLAEFVHDIGNQVEALLVREPGDHADHHLLVVLGKPQLLLQRVLILHLLLAEVDGVVRIGDMFVRLRIEIRVVDAVDNAAQAVAPGPQQAVQSLAVEWRLDFLRVGAADRGHRVRIDDAAL